MRRLWVTRAKQMMLTSGTSTPSLRMSTDGDDRHLAGPEVEEPKLAVAAVRSGVDGLGTVHWGTRRSRLAIRSACSIVLAEDDRPGIAGAFQSPSARR